MGMEITNLHGAWSHTGLLSTFLCFQLQAADRRLLPPRCCRCLYTFEAAANSHNVSFRFSIVFARPFQNCIQKSYGGAAYWPLSKWTIGKIVEQSRNGACTRWGLHPNLVKAQTFLQTALTPLLATAVQAVGFSHERAGFSKLYLVPWQFSRLMSSSTIQLQLSNWNVFWGPTSKRVWVRRAHRS